MDGKKARVVTIASIKGGVGKSTSSIILSNLLASKYRVLLIDMDDQASITSYYSDELEDKNIEVFKINIGEVIRKDLEISKTIINIGNNLDLIPSCVNVDDLNVDFYCENRHLFIEGMLKTKLSSVITNYDYIIIDTNPKRNFTLKISLISSNYVISPMTAEKWSVEAFEVLREFVKEVAGIPVFIVITRFKKNITHKTLLNIVQSQDKFLGVISEREDLNKRIGCNEKFDFEKDYIAEYSEVLDLFLSKTKLLI
ncbi:ParA family protein (plasmid) [Borrelia miyamotoi]|uniref:ParA family protein n=1 Tax=Borrelia miyamotoi TaxID=47466 RepID=A0A482CYR9_9SPIR|nr:ParA family protein [Borrelia miyamotoi]QBL99310.1 ParA family protein [Borrelia miyamotoi]QFP42596.1 ParA family protein [Borrelia miyamotoi]WAZ72661.1 ParA family protein [Borrelia miyamotoi]WDS49373.1 ParA family protein [Borrelia miyamotoi]WVI05573.1 ParA family protein [Borrelia miyamotoi]